MGGLVTQLVQLFGRGQVWVELQRHFRRDEQAVLQSLIDLAGGVPAAGDGVERRAVRVAGGAAALRRAHVHPSQDDAGAGGAAADGERRAVSEAAGADGAAVRGSAAGARRARRRWPSGSSSRSRISATGFRIIRCPTGETQSSFLRRLAQVGARDRYRPYHDRARAQIARELDLIEKLDLAGYFLIVWDLVNFCRQQGILVQGRGSAANSAVCYALGITAVDPVGMDLLFERFLSEERGEWPDIDLDLPSGDRRERVIQYVYERYGKLGAAMTANVITYRGRSAAREVGKVLGLAAADIDRMASTMSHFEFVDPEETIAEQRARCRARSRRSAHARSSRRCGARSRICRGISASIRAAWSSARAGSMRSCRSRTRPCPGRVVVQWDKDDCADLGIVKVDLLGLGMMAVLEEAIAIINSPSRSARSQLRTSKLELRT